MYADPHVQRYISEQHRKDRSSFPQRMRRACITELGDKQVATIAALVALTLGGRPSRLPTAAELHTAGLSCPGELE